MIVLVQQAAERAPVSSVNEGLLARIEESGLAHGFKLIVDAAHHMDVGEIIELEVFADVELLFEPFGLDVRHKVTDFGFAGRGKRLQQDDLEYVVFHSSFLLCRVMRLCVQSLQNCSHLVLSTVISRCCSTYCVTRSEISVKFSDTSGQLL